MDSSYPLRDRMAARRADKALTEAPQEAGGMAQPRASRLDASPTPGLDATPASTPARESFAQEGARASREAALAGTFGSGAKARAERSQNLEQRQSLFAEMRKSNDPGSAMFRRSAESIGLTGEEFNRGLWRAVGGDKPAPAAPAPAQAPLFGADIARRNIATQGIQGAAADYFARKDSEMLAKQSKGIDKAMAKPQAYQPSAANPGTAAKPARAAYRIQPTIAASARPTSPTMQPDAPVPTTSVTSGSDEYGGKMDLHPRPQKAKAVFSANTRFIDPQAEARAREKSVEQRTKANNEAIRKRRESQSTGPFARDSIAGRAFQWLQNDNFSGATQPPTRLTSKTSWKTPPPQTADIGKADGMPNRRKRGM